MSRRSLIALAVIGIVASTQPAQAQRFQFTPFAGGYFPTKPLVADTSGGVSIFETTSGPVVGGRITYWVSPRIGLEGSFGLATSKTHLIGSTTDFEFRSSTYMADARVLVHVNDPTAPTGLHLSGGVALTKSKNSFFNLAEDQDLLTYDPSIGFVVGLGVSRRIASGINLRIDLEDRIYTAKFDLPSGSTLNLDDQTQHDVVFSTGLAFGF